MQSIKFFSLFFALTLIMPGIVSSDTVVVQKETFAQGCGLDEPNGLRFGPDGNLYVTSEDGIYRINATDHPGECMGKFNRNDPETVLCPDNPQLSCNPQLLVPSDLVFSYSKTIPRSDQLLVADPSHHRVVSYDAHSGVYIDELISGIDASLLSCRTA